MKIPLKVWDDARVIDGHGEVIDWEVKIRIHLFCWHLLHAYYMPVIVLGSVDRDFKNDRKKNV